MWDCCGGHFKCDGEYRSVISVVLMDEVRGRWILMVVVTMELFIVMMGLKDGYKEWQ